MDVILAGTKIRDQSGLGSNGNVGFLNFPQNFRTETSLWDGSVSYSEHSL